MGRGWCRNDPALKIDGEMAKLTVFAATEDTRFATGPITIEVYGVSEAKISQSNMFGQQANVIVRDSDPNTFFEVNMLIPSNDDIEIRAVLEPAGSHDVPVLFAVGHTNAVVWFD